DHGLQDRAKALIGFLGIEVLDQTGRALDVGKQHRDLLAFALDRRARLQQALRQMARQIDRRGHAFAQMSTNRTRRRSWDPKYLKYAQIFRKAWEQPSLIREKLHLLAHHSNYA